MTRISRELDSSLPLGSMPCRLVCADRGVSPCCSRRSETFACRRPARSSGVGRRSRYRWRSVWRKASSRWSACTFPSSELSWTLLGICQSRAGQECDWSSEGLLEYHQFLFLFQEIHLFEHEVFLSELLWTFPRWLCLPTCPSISFSARFS